MSNKHCKLDKTVNEPISNDNFNCRGPTMAVYNEPLHIKLLEEVLSDGRLPIHFCDEANIDIDTLHEWLDTYPEFKEAYGIFMVRSEVAWMDNVKLATTAFRYWYSVMRKVFGYNNLNLYSSYQEMTAKELMDKLIEGISYGNFTDEQLDRFHTIIDQKIKLEKNEISDDVFNLQDTFEGLINNEEQGEGVRQPITLEIVDNKRHKVI